jgi:acetolactate synthase-1/2/3 large subunit
VLAVGTEFSETDYDFFFTGPVAVAGKLIRIDIDPRQLSRNIRPDIAIQSDASIALQVLHEALGDSAGDAQQGSSQRGAMRAADLRSTLCAQRDKKYEAFFDTIRAALPDVIIAGDSTQPTYYAWLNYETEQARRYFHSASGFGTLGYAIPAAIGAKLGQPDLPVIGLIGDGASQFTIGELASAVEAGVGVIFLLWNNNGYGEIKRFMEDADIPRVGVDIYTPDFIGLGRAFGCEVATATDHAQLKSELLAASQRTLPTLIEVKQEDFVDGYPMPS